MNSVSKELLISMFYSTDAREIGKDLQERYDKPHGTQIFHLLQQNHTLSQGSLNISSYFTKMRYLWDELSSIVENLSCYCEKSRKYIEFMNNQRLYKFLMGLNDSYTQVRSQILPMVPLPSINQAYALLLQEESSRGMTSGINIESPFDTALYTSGKNNKSKKKNGI